MVINAMVVETDEKKTLYAVMDDKGNCSSGSCEGCQCGAKMKTFSLPSDPDAPLSAGMKVEIHQDSTYLLHFFLLIFFPLLVLGGILYLPARFPGISVGSGLNLTALSGSLAAFILSALMVRRFGKKRNIRVIPGK